MTMPPPPAPRPPRRMPQRPPVRTTAGRRRDRGSGSLEVAILFPLVLTLTFGAIQAGLWFGARSLCQAAAEAGVRAGKVMNAPAGAGAGAARAYLADVAGGLLVGPAVSESRSPTTVTVHCSGRAQNVIPLPGFDLGVTQSARAGIERFTR